VGNRHAEGSTLGSLGELLSKEGKFDAAREVLHRGESLLRELGDQLGLATLLCHRACAEIAGGDIAAARTALATAEKEADAIGAGPDSEAGRKIIALRKALA
jgi:hypothetical protein